MTRAVCSWNRDDRLQKAFYRRRRRLPKTVIPLAQKLPPTGGIRPVLAPRMPARILPWSSDVNDIRHDRISRMALLGVSLLHWLVAALMVRENYLPYVSGWSSPAKYPLRAMTEAASWLGLC